MGALRVAPGVAGRGVDLDGDEPVAQGLAQALEPGRGDQPIGREPQAQHAEVGFGGHPGLDPAQVLVAQVEGGARLLGDRQRKRGLRHDGGAHRGLREHGEGEVAGEAHADDAHPGTAAALVLVARQGLAPLDHRGGLPGGPRRELLGDAGGTHGAQAPEQRDVGAGLTEEVRQHRGAAEVDDAIGEVDHLRRDARHLGEDDDGGAAPAAVDVALLPVRREPISLVRRRGHPCARTVPAGAGQTPAVHPFRFGVQCKGPADGRRLERAGPKGGGPRMVHAHRRRSPRRRAVARCRH